MKGDKETMMTEDEMYEFENEQVEFTVTCRMRRRWARAFLSMLKYMQWCGNAGHSSYVGLYADGDGDFRPKFTESGFGPFRMNPPCIRNFSGSNCTFDADFTAEDLDRIAADGGARFTDEERSKYIRMLNDGWLDRCKEKD